jgi:hypothetical protein
MPTGVKGVVFASAVTLGVMLAVGTIAANAQEGTSGVPAPPIMAPNAASYPGPRPRPVPAPASPSMLSQFRKFLIHNVLGEDSGHRISYRDQPTGRYELPGSKPWEKTTRTR